jgi:hypothetical protein
MFELLWQVATPLPVGPHAARVLPAEGEPDDGPLLALLAAGLKDEAIARQLGVSLRTVQRRISTVMRGLGARTRFQAGVALRDRRECAGRRQSAKGQARRIGPSTPGSM